VVGKFLFVQKADFALDPGKIVADSIEAGQPLVFVSINYRLNIFSFGDGKEKNLALKDQRLGIDWVRKNIAAFGGKSVGVIIAAVFPHHFILIARCYTRTISLLPEKVQELFTSTHI
jgi:hypothetical protein